VRARKRFAQHFLEPAWVAKLIDAIGVADTDRILEIGPGRGALTVPLAARAENVLAIEVDRELAAVLEAHGVPNLGVIVADVLTVDLAARITQDLGATRAAPARVVGNLPYNISSPILFRLLDVAHATRLLKDATLMLQREVADRLLAEPSTRDYGVLTLTTALGADVSRLLDLPPGAFRPAPKVRSSVVRLAFRPPPAGVHHPELFVDLVRAVFTQRRKMLANALAPFAATRTVSATEALAAAGIDPRRRPETLQLGEVATLADVFAGGDG